MKRTREQAIEIINRKIENPLDANDYTVRGGLLYERRGDYKKAMNDFDTAIELDPGYAEAYKHRGELYLKLGNYKKALKDFYKAIELEPNDIWIVFIYLNCGRACKNLNWTKLAITYYNKAVESFPRFAYKERGLFYMSCHKYQEAITDFTQFIKLKRKNSDTYYQRGLAYEKLGRYQKAIKDFDRTIKLNPQYADAYHRRGLAYGKIGKKEQKKNDLKVFARFSSALRYRRARGYDQ
jgi:tetratricopeptide (TPR) repeat protein